MRLDKFLSDMGVGTRKEIKKIISNKNVTVNGEIVSDNELKVDLDMKIECFGELLVYRKNIYLMMNKPAGVITATHDPKMREATVCDLLPKAYDGYDLFPVGRLDKDAVGLLILTTDGKYAHEMTSPKKNIIKTYYVICTGNIVDKGRALFANGITIDDGYVCKSAALMTVEEFGEKDLCRQYAPDNIKNGYHEAIIQISEGKFHQVKRMVAALGEEVLYLKRISIGMIKLPMDLREGEVVEIVVS